MHGLEGFVDTERVEGRFAARVARSAAQSRAQFGGEVTAARLRASDAADAWRTVLAVVLDKRQRGKAIPRSLQAQLDAALVALDAANDAVSALLGERLAA